MASWNILGNGNRDKPKDIEPEKSDHHPRSSMWSAYDPILGDYYGSIFAPPRTLDEQAGIAQIERDKAEARLAKAEATRIESKNEYHRRKEQAELKLKLKEQDDEIRAAIEVFPNLKGVLEAELSDSF